MDLLRFFVLNYHIVLDPRADYSAALDYLMTLSYPITTISPNTIGVLIDFDYPTTLHYRIKISSPIVLDDPVILSYYPAFKNYILRIVV